MLYLDTLFFAMVMVGFVYFALVAFANVNVKPNTAMTMTAKDRYAFVVAGLACSIGAIAFGYLLFRNLNL